MIKASIKSPQEFADEIEQYLRIQDGGMQEEYRRRENMVVEMLKKVRVKQNYETILEKVQALLPRVPRSNARITRCLS